MKKILLFLLLFCLSFISCYSQPKNKFESKQIKSELLDSIDKLNKRIKDIENKLILVNSSSEIKFKTLKQAIDSINKNISDSRLRESLKSAESTINKQDSLIKGFGVVFQILALFITLITIGIPLLLYFLTIKPVQKALKKAKLEFQSEINNYSVEQINEAIRNLKSRNHILIKNSLNHLLSLVPNNKFNEDQIYKIFSIIRFENIDNDTKEGLVFLLMNNNYQFCRDYFFSLLSEQVNTIKNNNLKNYTFNYLINFHKSEEYILSKLSQLVINSIDKKESLIVLMDWLVPDNEELVWKLLNFESLINQFNNEELGNIYEELKEKDYIIPQSSTCNTKSDKLLVLKEKLTKTILVKRITPPTYKVKEK